MAGNGREWPEMTGNGQGLPKIGGDGQIWPIIARNSRGWLEMARDAKDLPDKLHARDIKRRALALCDFSIKMSMLCSIIFTKFMIFKAISGIPKHSMILIPNNKKIFKLWLTRSQELYMFILYGL